MHTLGKWWTVLALIAAPLVVGSTYQYVRLSIIGSPRSVVVTEVDTLVSQLGIEYLVRVEGSDELYESRTPLAAGDATTLLVSDRLGLSVLVPGGRTFLHVLYHTSYLKHFLFLVACMAFAALAALWRVAMIGDHLWETILERRRRRSEDVVGVTERLVRATDLALDSAFALVLVSSFLLVGFAAAKAVLYVERTGALVSGAVILALAFALFSELPEKAVDFAFRVRSEDFWPKIRRILGNLIATGALCALVVKMTLFLVRTDFRSRASVWEILRDFSLFLIG